MPKTITTISGAGADTFFNNANVAGHDAPNEDLIRLLQASVVYTKDVVLTQVTTDYVIETTQDDLDLLNQVSYFPKVEEIAPPVDTTPPIITNQTINYVSENISTSFLDLNANEEVSWNITGGVDQSKFILTGNKLAFVDIPDYENPNSYLGSNVYSIVIQATDTRGNFAFKNLTIIVQDADDTLPPPEPEPEPELEEQTPNEIVQEINNNNEIINTITITTEEIVQKVDETPTGGIVIGDFSEQDLKLLYNELVKGFLVKGPLYLPHAGIVNGLYERIRKAIEEDTTENINLFLYRDIIDILFKTKNIFIHNMSIDKQLKTMRKKYKGSLCTINELKEQIHAVNAERGFGFEGTLGIKMRRFKPAIYHQALFNLPLAWYIYLHDTTDIVPSLYYMTNQYIKQFKTQEDSYNKLIQLLDEKYLLEEDDILTTSSSSDSPSSSDLEGNCNKSDSSSTSPPSSDNETQVETSQVETDDCGNPIQQYDDCGNPIETGTCETTTNNVSENINTSSTTTTTGGSTDEQGILGYYYDESKNNAVFFISGTFKLSQTEKTRSHVKTERKWKLPKRKTKRTFGAFGNPNNKTLIRNSDGTYSWFLDGDLFIEVKKRYRCKAKRKTKKHYKFCSLNETFKNY